MAGWHATDDGKKREITPERATGILTLDLIGDWDRWVHRRIESVELKDPLRFMRRVSLDFRYPTAPPAEYSPDDEPILVVPLTFLRKRTLLNFSLRDENGAVLPLLTRTQNANVAAAVLAAFAELRADDAWLDAQRKPAFRGRPLPAAIFEDLRSLAIQDRDDALLTWERLGRTGRPSTKPGHAPSEADWREAMVTDPDFMALARDFVFNYLALTPLVGQWGQRRVVKFSYEEVMPPVISRLRARVHELRERWLERRARRQVARREPRRRVTVAARLVSGEACKNLAFRVTGKPDDAADSDRIDCSYSERGSGTLDIDLPFGAYEIRPVVPEGFVQDRPGAVELVVGAKSDQEPITFTFMSVVRHDPRTELRDKETRPSIRETLATGMGWRAKRIVVITPAISHGGSYHFEAEAPEGLFVSRVSLRERGTTPTAGEEDQGPPLDLDRNRERVHLASSSVRQDRSAIVALNLRPRPWTIVRPACLSAIFTTCVLYVVAQRWGSIGANAGAVATLLLLVPGGLSAWAARSQENPVTTEVLFGLRMLALAGGLWAFVGAAAIVLNRRNDAQPTGEAFLGQPWGGTDLLLWALFALSVVTALILSIAWARGLWLPENRVRKHRMAGLRAVLKRRRGPSPAEETA